jgi:hypothetical protein
LRSIRSSLPSPDRTSNMLRINLLGLWNEVVEEIAESRAVASGMAVENALSDMTFGIEQGRFKIGEPRQLSLRRRRRVFGLRTC